MSTFWRTNTFLLFGGPTTLNGETWAYDYNENNWTKKKISPQPVNRGDEALAQFWGTDKILLYRGDNWAMGTHKEAWIYDESDNKWMKLSLSNYPDAYADHAMATVWGSDKIVLFGGFNEDGSPAFSDQTYIFSYSSSFSNQQYVSIKYDTGYPVSFNAISWDSYKTANSNIKFQFRSAKSEQELKSAKFMGPGGKSNNLYSISPSKIWAGHNGDRWFQFKIYFYTSNPSETSKLKNINITFSDYLPHGPSFWYQESFSDFIKGSFNNVTVTGIDEEAELILSKKCSWTKLNSGNSPSYRSVDNYRSNPAMASILGTDNIVLFGGEYSDKKSPFSKRWLNDTWIYKNSSNTWENVTGLERPPARAGHALVPIWSTYKILLFGGADEVNLFNDTWIFDLVSQSWTKQIPGNLPSGRNMHAMAPIFGTDNIVLFGGMNNSSQFMNDTWIYDYSDNNWTQLIMSNSTESHTAPSLAALWGTENVLLLNDGVVFESDFTNDTWKPLDSTGTPQNLSFSRISEIPNTDNFILFGKNISEGESWLFDFGDNIWTKRTTVSKPMDSLNFTLASVWDSHKVILFGGRDNSNQTWLFELGSYQNGTYTSKMYNAGFNSTFKSILWNASIPSETDIKIRIRSGTSKSDLNSKQFVGPEGNSSRFYTDSPAPLWAGHSADMFIQFKMFLSTGNQMITPSLGKMNITYNVLPEALAGSPGNMVDISDNTPLFKWNFSDPDSSHQTFFQVLISEEINFNNISFNSGEQYISEKSWQFPQGTGYTTLPDGVWYWKVRLMDSHDDWGLYSSPRSFRIDIIPPYSNITLPLNNTYHSHIDFITGTADDQTNSSGLIKIEVSIQRLDNNEYWNGSSWQSNESWIATNGTLTWNYDTSSIQWVSGIQYRIRSRGIDNASNVEIPNTGIRINFDSSQPISVIKVPANGIVTNKLAMISGNSTDPGGSGIKSIQINIKRLSDNRYWTGTFWATSISWLNVSGSTTWYYNSGAIVWTSGVKYQVQSRALDYAGNLELSLSSTVFLIDKEGPVSNIAYPLDDSLLKELSEISGNAYDSGGSTIDIVELCIFNIETNSFWDGLQWKSSSKEIWLPVSGTTSWSYDSTFINWQSSSGFNFSTRARDKAGNYGIQSSYIKVIIDNLPPFVDISYPLNGSELTELNEITGIASDNIAGIEKVFIIIEKTDDKTAYWAGSSWSSTKKILITELKSGISTYTWSYNSSNVKWESNTNYSIQWHSVDLAGNNVDGKGITFCIIEESPGEDYDLPKPIFLINNNDKHTNSRTVILTIIPKNNETEILEMSFSIDNQSWLPWESFNPVRPFELSNGDGEKIVYARIKDSKTKTASAFDSIILDTTPPEELSLVIDNGATFTNNYQVELDIGAYDDLSGLDSMSFSIHDTIWGSWEPFRNSTSIILPRDDGRKIIYMQVKDEAGNTAQTSNTIILDTTPPHSLSILINNGAVETNSVNVLLNLNASDDTSGLNMMSFSLDGFNWSPWEEFNNEKQSTLPSGDGLKHIYFRVIDYASNIADYVAATILLETPKPEPTKDQDDKTSEPINDSNKLIIDDQGNNSITERDEPPSTKSQKEEKDKNRIESVVLIGILILIMISSLLLYLSRVRMVRARSMKGLHKLKEGREIDNEDSGNISGDVEMEDDQDDS
jgi:hypothetical protein